MTAVDLTLCKHSIRLVCVYAPVSAMARGLFINMLRRHEASRCIKGDACLESHIIPDDLIKCRSVLKLGQKWLNPRFPTCTSVRAGKECPYSHEPHPEPQPKPHAPLAL